MIGILVSFWDGLFSGENMLVFFFGSVFHRVGTFRQEVLDQSRLAHLLSESRDLSTVNHGEKVLSPGVSGT